MAISQFQWEWSNFDPSQNSNPLIDYDKTLHNWLRPRDEHVTQNLCQSTVRERLGKYVKYKALSFFILISFFSTDSPTEVIRRRIFTHKGSNYAQSRKEVPFWGSARWPTTFRGSNSPKPSKMAYKHVWASANGLKTNDIIEDWRHWLSVARGQAAYTIYSILEITAAVYFTIFTTQR